MVVFNVNSLLGNFEWSLRTSGHSEQMVTMVGLTVQSNLDLLMLSILPEIRSYALVKQ